MRAKNRLTAGFLKSPPVGKHCDGAGLWLVKRDDGGAQWVLRVTVHGRRREMGLGGYPSLGLAEARKLAERWRNVAAAGRDPVKEREAEERAARREDISLAILTAAALTGWQGWLAFKNRELEMGRVPPELAGGSPEGMARIEIADLKERIRKLEAIANGVDL